jgi:phage tail-like protein
LNRGVLILSETTKKTEDTRKGYQEDKMTIKTRLTRTVGMMGAAALAVPMLLNVTTASAAYTAPSTTPITAAGFILMAGGQKIASFQEMAGINAQVEPREFIYGDPQGRIVHTKQFGKTTPPEVTLKRGLDDGKALWAWHQLVLSGTATARQTATIQAIAPSGRVVFSWTLVNAWPKKIEISGMKAVSADVLVETVTLVADHITINN